MARPKVTLNCVADQYANKAVERIIEFTDPETGSGGLISFMHLDSGDLLVNIYGDDEGVIVKSSKKSDRKSSRCKC